ncbi:DUF6630 family protein [Propionibacteriaceae bacterium Y1700]|uniref:DUF6630 family protein n=1 Tax=Microlunatus sp. Y1700 TaxID=3418487 RepID=UPI003DA76052
MDATGTWRDLATLLTDDTSVLAALTQAVADPPAYFRDHEDALDERGIDDPDDITGTIALIDALMDTGELAYLDWKSASEDVAGLLARLPRVQEAGIDLDRAGESQADVETVVAMVNRLLEPAGLVVIIIDEDSDAYPLVAVPLDRLPRILAAATPAGATIRLPRGNMSVRDLPDDPRDLIDHGRSL